MSTAVPSIPKRICAICPNPGPLVCSVCKSIGYCSKEHQKEHWKEHKTSCKSSSSSSSSSSLTSSSRPSSSDNDKDVAVNWEDQQRINSFSRLNLKLQNLKDEMKTKKLELANNKDAVSDIESLIDDDACRIKVGEVFFSTDNDAAEAFAKKKHEEITSEVNKLQKEIDDIGVEMDKLRKELYGKFGKAINLENSDQTINDDL